MGALTAPRRQVPGPGDARGYTLIELLVVLAIIGVLVSLTAHGLRGDPARAVAEEARRLGLTLELAQGVAHASGDRIAFSASSGDYRFWRRERDGHWRPIDDEPALKPRRLAPPLRIAEVRLDGGEISPQQRIVLRTADPPLLAIALEGHGVRALVRSAALAGRMEIINDAARD